jgi:hypothetical protein
VLEEQECVVSEVDQQQLKVKLIEEELWRAIGELAKNKSQGPDRLPVEFFLFNWKIVGPSLLQALQHDIEQGYLHPDFNKCHIVSPSKKKGDQKQFKNKRPVMLFNVIYKIGAKAFQIRLSNIIDGIISPEQTRCIPGRNIHKGMLYMCELIHYAKLSGVDHVLAKLDIEQAFDCIKCTFILQFLNKMGFGTYFLHFLRMSYSSATSVL